MSKNAKINEETKKLYYKHEKLDNSKGKIQG